MDQRRSLGSWFKRVALLSLLSGVHGAGGPNDVDFWNVERPKDMANIKSLEVMCGKTFMEVQISFDRPFNGIIFSKGAVDQYNCIYIKPQTGSSTYSFNILYDQCGTKPDMNGKFYENNIVIQYDKDLIEVWDEAKRLRCEWYNDYEKGITKAPIRVSDLEVVELNFRGDNVDCWMEIQHGKGPWASLVSGIVPLGTTLTMVVGIKDKQGEFDMRVKSCSAEAEGVQPINLSDEHGCVLRPKMISKFMKIAGADSRASVVTYAFFHAFKFPDSMSVHIKCKVEICRFGCPEHCQKPDRYTAQEQDVSASLSLPNYGPRYEAQKRVEKSPEPSPKNFPEVPQATLSKKQMKNMDLPPPQLKKKSRENVPLEPPVLTKEKKKFSELREEDKKSKLPGFLGLKLPQIPDISNIFAARNTESLPPTVSRSAAPAAGPGPDSLKSSYVPLHRTENKEQPLVYPSLIGGQPEKHESGRDGVFPHGPRKLPLQKRSAAATASRKRRAATEEMGVTSGYKVISEVDLAFKPSFEGGVGVTVFQGRMMPEEVVYGVCLPASGFSALFVLLSLLTVISVLVSGFVCYHRQIQKSVEEGAPKPYMGAPKPYLLSGKTVNISNLFNVSKI